MADVDGEEFLFDVMNFNVVLCNGWSDIKELASSNSFIDERMNMIVMQCGS